MPGLASTASAVAARLPPLLAVAENGTWPLETDVQLAAAQPPAGGRAALAARCVREPVAATRAFASLPSSLDNTLPLACTAVRATTKPVTEVLRGLH